MDVRKFIADRLDFRGGIAFASIVVSSLIIVVAVAVASGFRREIRASLSELGGDVMISSRYMDYYSEGSPISAEPPYLKDMLALPGVEKISPVIYRAGIVKKDEEVHGVLFKGVEMPDSVKLKARIPARFASMAGFAVGDKMTASFVGEKVKMRNFTVSEIYEGGVDVGGNVVVFVPLKDLRRLNGWNESLTSVLEVKLSDKITDRDDVKFKTMEISSLCLQQVALSLVDRYPNIFDWLDLIDVNVLAILILMIIVAGFNMVSGLLIILFRNISTIGILKALGMTSREVSGVFLRLSSRLVIKGMLLGNAIGLAFCLIQGSTHLLKLNPANYFLSFVPVHIDWDLLVVADLIAFAAIMLALLLPSLFIAKVDPATTVKAK